MKTGAPVGASTPPSGSSVIAIIWPGSTCRVRARHSRPLEQPCVLRNPVLEDPDLVVLAVRRGSELPHDQRGVALGRDHQARLSARALEHLRIRIAEHRELAVRGVEVAREPCRPDPDSDCRDGGDGGNGREHGNGEPGPERDDVRALAPGLRQDPLAQGGCGDGPCGGVRQSARDRPEGGELLPAALARGEMGLVSLPLLRVEGVEGVAGGQLVVVVHASFSGVSSRSSRSRESPENILLLIVPSGWPRRAASSDWVKPP